MKEIKFRAWHKEFKKMISAEEMAEDQLTLLPTGQFINVHGGNTKLSKIYDFMIPLQYTGLKDKNGKEIYEGDIIKQSKYKYIVEWSLGEASYFLHAINDNYNCYLHDGINYIIGNIYENPELLEERKK